MKREIYDEDHEAFRASVKEFLDRQVVPDLDEYAEATGCRASSGSRPGKQGFLGLEVPEQYGGTEAGDYRFNAVLTEELAKVNMTAAVAASASTPTSSRRTSCTSPPTSRSSAGCPRFCSGELLTAIGMTEPGGGSDLAA